MPQRWREHRTRRRNEQTKETRQQNPEKVMRPFFSRTCLTLSPNQLNKRKKKETNETKEQLNKRTTKEEPTKNEQEHENAKKKENENNKRTFFCLHPV